MSRLSPVTPVCTSAPCSFLAFPSLSATTLRNPRELAARVLNLRPGLPATAEGFRHRQAYRLVAGLLH